MPPDRPTSFMSARWLGMRSSAMWVGTFQPGSPSLAARGVGRAGDRASGSGATGWLTRTASRCPCHRVAPRACTEVEREHQLREAPRRVALPRRGSGAQAQSRGLLQHVHARHRREHRAHSRAAVRAGRLHRHPDLPLGFQGVRSRLDLGDLDRLTSRRAIRPHDHVTTVHGQDVVRMACERLDRRPDETDEMGADIRERRRSLDAPTSDLRITQPDRWRRSGRSHRP